MDTEFWNCNCDLGGVLILEQNFWDSCLIVGEESNY